jgi:mannose-6-phosphate isomerase-like protein (cupin superfamily)
MSDDDVVVNPQTGEEVRFLGSDDAVLTMHVVWPRPGRRTLAHVHPSMEERWTVLAGDASFDIDGIRVDAGPGTTVVAPPGRRHLAWNSGDGPAELRIEMRPPRRWESFVRRLFAGDDAVALLKEHTDEIVLAPGDDAR